MATARPALRRLLVLLGVAAFACTIGATTANSDPTAPLTNAKHFFWDSWLYKRF